MLWCFPTTSDGIFGGIVPPLKLNRTSPLKIPMTDPWDLYINRTWMVVPGRRNAVGYACQIRRLQLWALPEPPWLNLNCHGKQSSPQLDLHVDKRPWGFFWWGRRSTVTLLAAALRGALNIAFTYDPPSRLCSIFLPTDSPPSDYVLLIWLIFSTATSVRINCHTSVP